jgi:hypothetical protein
LRSPGDVEAVSSCSPSTRLVIVGGVVASPLGAATAGDIAGDGGVAGELLLEQIGEPSHVSFGHRVQLLRVHRGADPRRRCRRDVHRGTGCVAAEGFGALAHIADHMSRRLCGRPLEAGHRRIGRIDAAPQAAIAGHRTAERVERRSMCAAGVFGWIGVLRNRRFHGCPPSRGAAK